MANLYVKAVPPPDMNRNTEWFTYPGVWTTYILILFFAWLLVLSVSGCTPGMAWTVVNLCHFIVLLFCERGSPGLTVITDLDIVKYVQMLDLVRRSLCSKIDVLVLPEAEKVTYHFFHWKKGTPFADDQGIYNALTWWEQIDNGNQLTRNRKFLTVVPVVLYLIASHTTDYEHPMLFFNTFAVMVLVIAKFPNMHKVRIFGINGDL